MILERLEVKHFGRVRDVDLELGPGLNVVHGPNDLGKSTLAEAVRAALLLGSTSKEAERFVPWDELDRRPMVRLTFRDGDGRRWRVRKRFGSSGGAGALLEREDQGELRAVAKGRDVDGTLRELLRWGVPAPGGRGGPRGIPDTFLARALLGSQGQATALFDQGVDQDPGSSGREWLEETLAAYARDEAFDAVLERARRQVDRAFRADGKPSGAAGSPFREAADQVTRRLEHERTARHALEQAESAHRELEALRADRKRAEASALEAAAGVRRAERRAFVREREALLGAITRAEKELEAREAARDDARRAAAVREAAQARLEELRSNAEELARRLAHARAVADRAALGRAEQALAVARERERAAAARARGVERARGLREQRALEAQLAERRALSAEAEAWATKAAEREAEAQELKLQEGPDPEALAAVDEAAGAYEVARARLTVGLRLRLELAEDVEAEVVVDGSPAPFTGDEGAGRWDADARVEVVLRRGGERLARFEARAGDEALHTEAARTRAALDALLEPLLTRHGAASRDELHERAREAEHRRRVAAERRGEAGRLREKAAELRAKGASSELEERLAQLRERLGPTSESATSESATHAQALLDGDESLEALEAAASRALNEALEGLRTAEAEVVRNRARLEASEAALEGGEDGPGREHLLEGEPEGKPEATADALAEELRSQREAIAAAVAALPQVEEDATLEESCTAARETLAKHRARLAALDERAPESAPEDAAEPADGSKADDEAITPEDATRTQMEAEAEVRRIREAISRLEGRLEREPVAQARDRWDRARAATERARAAEREVELEYGGYRRLVSVMEATAARLGRDLGAALVAPVQSRFRALLESVGGQVDRYGGLAFDADGAAQGAMVDGDLRDLGALSMGTREQLATLLRLTLAERLGSFLLLDDHLTHTDAARAKALGRVMREVAGQVQVIVFTCHPESYLRPKEPRTAHQRGRLRVVDAAALLR